MTRPNFIKLLAPLATFVCGLALFLALSHGSGVDPASSADVDLAALGADYLQQARETGDPGYYTRAERSFDAALRRDPRDVSALLGAGTLAGLRHDFREQLQLGVRARRLGGGLAALPVIADARIELGRHREAATAIQRLLDEKPGLAAYARASYFRELSGDPAGAVEAMRLAASAGGGSPENRAHVQVLLGDLELARGRVAAARLAYTAALRSLPGYPAATVGLARTDAAGGDLRRAAARLRRASERLPLTSTLVLVAQVEAELARGAAAAEDAAREHARRSSAALDAARAQQAVYREAGTAPDAEGVVFEADFGSPAAAVALGRRVWRAAPSLRSADALGWALTRAGRPAEGYELARRALALGSRDPVFRLHAGIAARRAGLRGPAARHLEIAAAGRAALVPEALALLEEARL